MPFRLRCEKILSLAHHSQFYLHSVPIRKLCSSDVACALARRAFGCSVCMCARWRRLSFNMNYIHNLQTMTASAHVDANVVAVCNSRRFRHDNSVT